VVIYHYKGYWNCDAKCDVEIKKEQRKVTVILTELPDNPGTSVTNMVEHLATKIYHEFLSRTPIEDIAWIEHYPANRIRKETFDKVMMEWDGKNFAHPQWKRMQA
jgi:hypothetical protein